MPDSTTGGCLCGALRYAIDSSARQTAHCHCTMCRRASGALAVTFTVVPVGSFRWTQGAPAVYRSSEHAERRFCPACGSQLTFWTQQRPDDLDVNTGCLDDPEAFPAERHVWAANRVRWLTVDPHLPGLDE